MRRSSWSPSNPKSSSLTNTVSSGENKTSRFKSRPQILPYVEAMECSLGKKFSKLSKEAIAEELIKQIEGLSRRNLSLERDVSTLNTKIFDLNISSHASLTPGDKGKIPHTISMEDMKNKLEKFNVSYAEAQQQNKCSVSMLNSERTEHSILKTKYGVLNEKLINTQKTLEQKEKMIDGQMKYMSDLTIKNMNMENQMKSITEANNYMKNALSQFELVHKYSEDDIHLAQLIKIKDERIRDQRAKNKILKEQHMKLEENLNNLFVYLSSLATCQSNMEELIAGELEDRQQLKRFQNNASKSSKASSNRGVWARNGKSKRGSNSPMQAAAENLSDNESECISQHSNHSTISVNSEKNKAQNKAKKTKVNKRTSRYYGDEEDNSIYENLSSTSLNKEKEKEDPSNNSPKTTRFEQQRRRRMSVGGAIMNSAFDGRSAARASAKHRTRKSESDGSPSGNMSSISIIESAFLSNSWKQVVAPQEDEPFPFSNLLTMFYSYLNEYDPGNIDTYESLDLRQRTDFFSGFVVNIASTTTDSLLNKKTLAKFHNEINLAQASYVCIGQAILSVLKTRLGDQFDEQTRISWIEAFVVVSESIQKLRGEKVRKGALSTALRFSTI